MGEGRTKKAAVNFFYNFSNLCLNLILTFISRTVFINVFGVAYLGMNSLFTDVLNLLSMADLGFNTAMVYSFYKPLAEKDYDRMAALTTFYKHIYIVISIFITVVGLLLIPFLPYLINLENPIEHLNIYYILSLSNIVCSYMCIYKTSILTADQKNYKITRVTMIISILKTIIQIVAIVLFENYILYLLIGTITVLLNNIWASSIAVKEYSFIKRNISLELSEKKKIFENITSVFLYKVSSVLLTATDNLLISIITGTIMVGYYSNYLLIQNKIAMFYTIIFSSLTASIGNLIIKEKAEKRYKIFNCEQSVCFIICGIIVPCYTILIDDFIKIWLGNDYILSPETVLIIGLNMYLACVLQPLWSYREAAGLYRKTKWIMFICAIENIAISIILGVFWGITGILLASAISRVTTYVWYEPKILFSEYFSKSSKKYYLSIIQNFILIIFLIIFCDFLLQSIVVETIWKFFLKSIITLLICGSIVIVSYYRSDGITYILRKIKNR